MDVGVSRDLVGEEMRYDRDSQASIELLESIAGLLNGFFYRCRSDENFTCLFLTSGFQRLTGYSASTFIGANARRFASLAYPQDKEAIRLGVEAALHRHASWDLDYRLVGADGRPIWVHENGAGVFDDEGELLFLEGAIVHIGRQKEQEAKLEDIVVQVTTISSDLLAVVGRVLGKLKTLDLLSLNARIQVGRASDDQSGFAAVAAEISKLSESTRADANALPSLIAKLRTFSSRDGRITDPALGDHSPPPNGRSIL